MIKINGLTDIDTVGYTQALLQNPVFNTVFMEFRAAAIDSWSSTKADQVDIREKAWAQYVTAEELLNTFKAILEDARLQARVEQEDEGDNG